ncbi:MAG TPA: HAD-IIIC family phosphatase, partial [Verrucomicrobiae bacterium]|nr:HAD-IIIC family phosphatase [Verrucomicrobiae bacterium]
ALKQAPCKVIALDCDHTLWRGVCGEDGPNGVEVDQPRRALQEFMRDQLDAGRLLCLCSKNNEADVAAVFERQPMPLQPEHFVSRQVNWHPKSLNLRAMADELKLGLDSIVLVDDNPMECAEVTANCPEAVALQLPEDPNLIPQFLKHCWIFDQPRKTAEDKRRTELYRQNREREALRKESLNFAEFLAALELKVEIENLGLEDIPRAAQLTQKTNQFNSTTRRRGEGELQQCIDRDGCQVRTVRVSDRFGDYGLVGLVVFKVETAAVSVDSLLLSCRVLGKGVEYRMIADLGRVCREHGLERVNVHFTPSARNQPARDFLDRIGGPFREPQNGGFVYAIPVEIAERVTFQPTASSELVPARSTQPVLVSTPKSGKRFNRWQWVALEASDPSRILEQIHANSPKRLSTAVNGDPTSDLEKQLCEVWQELLRLERVGVHDDFFELGGHSFLAVRMFAQIEKLTGKRLPVLAIFQAPTVAQLAQRISETAVHSAPPSLIVPIQPNGARPPLFLVHGAGGDVMWGYANLVQHLAADQPVYGIQTRPTDPPDKFATLEDMAADYVEALREFRSEGPYRLGGYCFGGNLAYEMARQLRAQHQEVSFLALIESTPEGGDYERVFWWRPDFLFRFGRNAYYWLKDFLGYPPEERRSLVQRKFKVFGRKFLKRLWNDPDRNTLDLDDVIDTTKFPEHEIKLWQAHLRLLEEHVSKPYEGRVTVFRTAAHPLFSSYQDDLGWSSLVGHGVTVKVIPGSHGNIFLEPNVRDLALNMASVLQEIPFDTYPRTKPSLQPA